VLNTTTSTRTFPAYTPHVVQAPHVHGPVPLVSTNATKPLTVSTARPVAHASVAHIPVTNATHSTVRPTAVLPHGPTPVSRPVPLSTSQPVASVAVKPTETSTKPVPVAATRPTTLVGPRPVSGPAYVGPRPVPAPTVAIPRPVPAEPTSL
jgi:hypothetical protein